MLYLTEEDVRRFLGMKDAIALVRGAFEGLASGDALNQPRRRLALPSGSVLHYMAGSSPSYFGAKVYSTHRSYGAHFIFLLYRAEDAEPLALFEANALGQIRTGAASGFATELLAREDSRTVAVIGSGFQARTQLEAVASVLNLKSALVWSRSPEKRNAFAAECAAFAAVEPAHTAEQAVRGADVVITATNAKDPVIESGWVEPGTHINAMGSNQATRRELPSDLVRRADLIAVDCLEQARMESGDLLLGLKPGEWDRVVELKNVMSGRSQGRLRPDQITIFKSNGLAAQDVAAAGFIYEKAVEAGLKREVPYS
jgi:alanine dehydrogenase